MAIFLPPLPSNDPLLSNELALGGTLDPNVPNFQQPSSPNRLPPRPVPPDQVTTLPEVTVTLQLQQSPVDLVNPLQVNNALAMIPMWTRPAGTMRRDYGTLVIEPDAPSGSNPDSMVNYAGINYILKSKHFHYASEHKVAGAGYAGELHLVHKSAAGDYLVVGIFLVIDNNSPLDPNLTTFKDNVDAFNAGGSGGASANGIWPPNWRPISTSGTWSYKGSLTAHSLSENVTWVIYQGTRTITQALLDAIKQQPISGPVPPSTNRPIQPLNRRYILQYGKYSSYLMPGEIMYPYQERRSPNGRYLLLMQPDGNLVIYDLSIQSPASRPGTGIWASGSLGPNLFAYMQQTDGNFVIYAGTLPVWATMTNYNPGAYLQIKDDGRIYIYPALSSSVPFLWSTP